jgi:hypothetical protein
MPRVLIIAENSLQQQRLCRSIDFDHSVQITTANLRQINPKTLKAFEQSDLIIVEDITEEGDPRTIEFMISSLKRTGLPIVLLPSLAQEPPTRSEPLILNLTETAIARPGLAALINKIRNQFTATVASEDALPFPHKPSPYSAETDLPRLESSASDNSTVAHLEPNAIVESLTEDYLTPLSAAPAAVSKHPGADESNKILFACTAMGRISKQLREPLSNMNLAIHMLSNVRSIEERDRYINLLREEYARELQLLNEMEHVYTTLQTKLQSSSHY